jgi:hypothetical protein
LEETDSSIEEDGKAELKEEEVEKQDPEEQLKSFWVGLGGMLKTIVGWSSKTSGERGKQVDCGFTYLAVVWCVVSLFGCLLLWLLSAAR